MLSETSLYFLGRKLHQLRLQEAIPEPKREIPMTVQQLGVELGGGLQNILRVLKAATPAEREFWAKWYHHAQADVRSLANQYRIPFDLAAAAVAAMSPGSKWKTNLDSADKLFALVRQNPGASVETLYTKATKLKEIAAYNSEQAADTSGGIASYGDNIKKALIVLLTGNTRVIQTRKVWVFYRGLVDPDGVQTEIEDGSIDEKTRKMLNRKTTVDGHAINVWRGFKQPLDSLASVPEALFDQIERDYQEASRITGLSTRAVQAITWYVWKYTEDPPPAPQLSFLAPVPGGGEELHTQELNPYEYRKMLSMATSGKLAPGVTLHRAERGPSGQWVWQSYTPKYGEQPLNPTLSGPARVPEPKPKGLTKLQLAQQQQKTKSWEQKKPS